MATIEMLEGDYVKEALETDKLLDECLHRCNLERQLGKQVRMLGALEPRKRADEIEEKADGKLGEFTPIATTCVAYVSVLEQHGRGQKTMRESRRGGRQELHSFSNETLATSGSSRCSKPWCKVL